MYKIGNIVFDNIPVILAPMEDVTDASFRYMCKLFGADLMFTEFVSSDALVRDVKKSLDKLKLFDYERPVGIQIYGHNPEAMAGAVEYVNKACPDIIDLNFGCPVKKIANRGAGAGLMRNLNLMKTITEMVIDKAKYPVTAKTRLGWDNNSLNVEEVALLLQNCGIKALTIHARTREQMYKGEADWTLISKIKNDDRISIPIIGNGDITSATIAAEKIAQSNVDAIMIGRAAIGRPWIFKEVKHYLKYNEELKIPSVKERVDIAREHLNISMQFKEGKKGIYEMRRHFSLYFKSIPNFKETRIKLLTAQTTEDILDILKYIETTFSNFDIVDDN